MKKRILAALLMLAMILAVVPAGVLAAGGDWTELQKDLTDGAYTDQTAVSSGSYEYEVVGSDGSRQTVTVQAAGDQVQPGTTVTPTITWKRTLEPKEGGKYYQEASEGGIFGIGKHDKTGSLLRDLQFIDTNDYKTIIWGSRLSDVLALPTDSDMTYVWDYNTSDQRADVSKVAGLRAATWFGWADSKKEWNYASVRRFSGTFTWPEGYDLDDNIEIVSANDANYQEIYDAIAKDAKLVAVYGGKKVVAVNDDMYVYIYADGDELSVTNANSHLAFFTGTVGKGVWSTAKADPEADGARTVPPTFNGTYAIKAFQNVLPNLRETSGSASTSQVTALSKALQNKMKYSDGWYSFMDGNSVSTVLNNCYKGENLVGKAIHIEIFAMDNNAKKSADPGGGMDELQIKFTKRQPTQQTVTVKYFLETDTGRKEIGSSTMTNVLEGTQVVLAAGTDANQRNYMKAQAEIANGNKQVSDGSQVKTLTVTKDGENIVEVVYSAKTGSFTIIHVRSDGTSENEEIKDLPTHFNLTNHVTEHYLYGGTFDSIGCNAEDVHDFKERDPMDFAPTAGKTYYIWEVPNTYLKPANYCLWNAKNGKKDVVGLYVMTPVDRLVYQQIGFDVEGDTEVSKVDGESIAYGVVDFTRDGSVYEEIYVKGGKLQSQKGGTVDAANRDAGYIGLYKLNDQQFKAFKENKETGVTFAPYWITLDGVKVTAYTRTMKYRGTGYSNADIQTSGPNASMTLAQSSDQTLRFAAAFNSDYDETEQPVEPVEPTEPVTGTVTLTIHDNGKITERPVQKGDLTGALSYEAPAGKLFAGWYLDEACRTPADLKNVQEDLELYAKYVSNAYLQQRMVSRFTLSGRKVSILSAVEKGDYAETGLMVNGEKVVVEKYVKRYGIYNGRNLFGLSSSTPLMRWELDLKGYQVGEKLTVTPYWVTADGTVVSGESRSYTVTRLGLQG